MSIDTALQLLEYLTQAYGEEWLETLNKIYFNDDRASDPQLIQFLLDHDLILRGQKVLLQTEQGSHIFRFLYEMWDMFYAK